MTIDATFWVAISFIIFISVLIYFKIPQKVNETLNKMIFDIKNEIDESEKLRNEAKNYFNDARKKIQQDINKKREKLENEIDEEINKTEKEIIDLKNKAPEKINKIAIETSDDLINQLIGIKINNSSISAIVQDLSKKNKDKYYDN